MIRRPHHNSPSSLEQTVTLDDQPVVLPPGPHLSLLQVRLLLEKTAAQRGRVLLGWSSDGVYRGLWEVPSNAEPAGAVTAVSVPPADLGPGLLAFAFRLCQEVREQVEQVVLLAIINPTRKLDRAWRVLEGAIRDPLFLLAHIHEANATSLSNHRTPNLASLESRLHEAIIRVNSAFTRGSAMGVSDALEWWILPWLIDMESILEEAHEAFPLYA